jgi:hypothetical protein
LDNERVQNPTKSEPAQDLEEPPQEVSKWALLLMLSKRHNSSG